jgi:hypothetical protein
VFTPRVFGIKFSGFIAWCLWRTVYLLKLPRLAKKLRVISGWMLELLFSREIEQMINLRDVDELTRRLTRIRERAGNPQIALLGEANR